MPSGMKLQIRPRPNTLHHRLVWQCASLLLSYPDQGRLSTVDEPLALRPLDDVSDVLDSRRHS